MMRLLIHIPTELDAPDDRDAVQHAQVQQNRDSGAQLVAFEVDESWIRSLRTAAIPEHGTGGITGQPRLVDVRFAGDQMEISPNLIDALQQFIIPGSGRVLEVKP
jgi:hypothetical protein